MYHVSHAIPLCLIPYAVSCERHVYFLLLQYYTTTATTVVVVVVVSS
jgi:hypothetical protein